MCTPGHLHKSRQETWAKFKGVNDKKVPPPPPPPGIPTKPAPNSSQEKLMETLLGAYY
jgi:hypothetical protein